MNARQGLIGAVLAAIGASACCVGPLLLVTLGVGGAWVASLTRLEPLRPVFVVLTLALLGFAGFRLYRRPAVCESGRPCADDRVRRRRRALFWLVSVPLLALLAFPWYAPLFY